jgi:hypothetical protein
MLHVGASRAGIRRRGWHHGGMSIQFPPQVVQPESWARDLPDALRGPGYAVLGPEALVQTTGAELADLQRIALSWNDLPADAYLRDGGRYRRRRHSCFIVEGDSVVQVPHRAHWQPVEYNALHGGIERWFEPMSADVVANPSWSKLLLGMGSIASGLKGARPWYVEAHQFRIDTTDGIGRPTPEGAHRDGVDFVAVTLLERSGIKGGETRVFEADGPNGIRFTMAEPWTTLLLDDARVIHETTPIQPLTPGSGHRDTLVITLRAGGFQGPA